MTLRVDAATRQRLDRLAKSTSRTRAFLAETAIKSYLDQNEWQIAAIEQGKRDADAGNVIAHDEVAEWLASWGTKREKRRPK